MSNPTLREEIEGIIEVTTDGLSTKELILLMDRLESLLLRAIREARIDELSIVISTWNDSNTDKQFFEVVEERLTSLRGEQ